MNDLALTCQRLTLVLVAGALISACASGPKARTELGPYACDAAGGATPKRQVNIIYIHGASQYTAENRDAFKAQIAAMHQLVRTEFSHYPQIRAGLLNNCTYRLAEAPIVFYWGDIPGEEIERVYDLLQLTGKGERGFVGSQRRRFALALHDVVWLAKGYNTRRLFERLHREVTRVIQAGDDFVLWAHSAGGLLAVHYLGSYLPIVDVRTLGWPARALKGWQGQYFTCVQALYATDLIRVRNDGTLLGVLQDLPSTASANMRRLWPQYLAERADMLRRQTAQTCLPAGRLRGIVTAGSPVALLISMGRNVAGDLVRALTLYLYNLGVSVVNVTHRGDMLGLAVGELPTELRRELGVPIDAEHEGFIVNYTTASGGSFIGAHSWYLRKPKPYVRAWAETYAKGYDRVHPAAK
ncbi:MAG: hypothetical protein V3T85_02210 [Acidiferrobacterales bacterium]